MTFGARPWWRWRIHVVAFVTLVLAGCANDSDRASDGSNATVESAVEDDAGVLHGTTDVRRRIVSTIPGFTDLFVQIGAAERLVGRTRYDVRTEVAHLPSVGGGLDPDLEMLTVLEPDLVVLWTDTDARAMTQRISELGIETYAARVDGMADFERHARQLGRLTGLEPRISDLLGGIHATFDSIRGRIEGAERPTVLYVIALDPPMVAGPGTFLDALVTASGGENLFADLEVAWPQVSLEAIVQRNPDVVVIAVQEGSYAPLRQRRDGWSQIGAVREGRVVEVDPDLFNRPGPGVGEAALSLARSLHPDRFRTSIGNHDPVGSGN